MSKEGGKILNERMKNYKKSYKKFDLKQEVLPSSTNTIEEQYDDIQNFLKSLKR